MRDGEQDAGVAAGADAEVSASAGASVEACAGAPANAYATAAASERFVRNEAAKEGGSRFPLVRAFRCAASGIAYAVRTQRNMKIHLVIAVVAVTLGFVFGIDASSWAAVILCIAAVFAAECVNTAVESVVDLVSPDYHELARRAKDCAAGAVLVFALVALIVAVVVFGPPAWNVFFG